MPNLTLTTPASLMAAATWSAMVAQKPNASDMAYHSYNHTVLHNEPGHHHPVLDLMPSSSAHTTSEPAIQIPRERDDLIENNFVQIFFCILYTTVFILGVFGNVLVCYVVLRNRAMQTVTNIFITNLALSDILLCILAVPFTPLYTFMGRWAFGRTLCHLVSFAQGCSIYISTLTLTSIAIDRYFVIIYPFHPRMKMSTCIAIVISIWVISLLATLPYGMYVKVVNDYGNMTEDYLAGNATQFNFNSSSSSNSAATAAAAAVVASLSSSSPTVPLNVSYSPQRNYDAYMQIVSSSSAASTASMAESDMPSSSISYCEEDWPTERYRKVFGSVTTILQFVLPFIIISICYIWISFKLNARAKAKPGSKSSRKEEADRDRKKRTNRMLIAMVGVFGLSWLPLNVVNIFDDFYEKSNEWRFYTLFFFVAHSIAMSSTCYNPFLYAWLNENFRKEFKHVLPCFNPSNNNIINITRGYNRSDRNTCGPRLHHGNGGAATRGSSLENDDHDDGNAITQDTTLTHPKDKLLIIPREPTYGNGHNALSPCLDRGVNVALVQCSKQVEILLNDNDIRNHRYDDFDNESCEEQTIEMRFNETPFISSDNNTTISIMETSTSCDRSGGGSSERMQRSN
ncbi:neuropeptide Y receptor type 6 [Musca vetustissima]|uniref:neuropeptide Y receptor type 6 n=1 Tax=Musca vetustissima TaxID=27455 RepID=UPI002AB6B9FF|nr:neuropeptide Y receptor type 6 [Musca vetustissima]